ncbi:hypothetical protein HIM_11131 [Hirsutella minnesotensis 3608]|uniref:Uncharacterized protein n=1 Tax=Hirsutella minnesotensis 3608 TaxID=1043627 RepID=A0A0F8A1J3_9HYPO|nr:hypothetical protein HIM_11131 [Hirsutella minnesotensis 3608]
MDAPNTSACEGNTQPNTPRFKAEDMDPVSSERKSVSANGYNTSFYTKLHLEDESHPYGESQRRSQLGYDQVISVAQDLPGE